MSRTDKDRPYWVKLNDDGKFTEHDHLSLGKKFYKKVYLRDENGEYIWERRILKRLSFYYYKADLAGVTYEQAFAGYIVPENHKNYTPHLSLSMINIDDMKKYNPDYWNLYVETEIDLGWFATYELVLDFVYSEECTAGQKLAKGSHKYRSIKIPCIPQLDRHTRQGYYYNDKISKEYRQFYHASRRENTRKVLRNYTKKWNTGIDIDEVEYITEQHRNGAAWWG